MINLENLGNLFFSFQEMVRIINDPQFWNSSLFCVCVLNMRLWSSYVSNELLKDTLDSEALGLSSHSITQHKYHTKQLLFDSCQPPGKKKIRINILAGWIDFNQLVKLI